MIGVGVKANGFDDNFVIPARMVPQAQRAILRSLVGQTEREAIKRASGGKSSAGSYPIPQVSNTLRSSFGERITDDKGVVFNSARHARAVHQGFRPYGNPHARPIRPRMYFDDALRAIDYNRALEAGERVMARQATGGAA